MPTKSIYFDESGFTGYNLLDANQPIFSISSTDIPPDIAAALLREAFPRYQGAEFKFSNIWRSRQNRLLLTDFARLIRDRGNSFYVWRTDKRFAVLTKIVDNLIEPIIHAAGYDFYADGFCWKYVNLIHFGLTQFETTELYDALIKTYQAFSRTPSPESLQSLQVRYRLMANSADERVQSFLDQMAAGAEAFEEFHDLSSFTGTDELYVSTMLALVRHWRRQTNDDLALFHDDSAHFFRFRPMWEQVTNANVPQQIHVDGVGDEVQFPLRVASTEALNSRDCASVQLCDLVAGLTSKIFDQDLQEEERDLLNNVIDNGLSEITANGIRFEPVFPDQIPPRPLNGPDMVEKMRRIMYPQ